MLMHSNQSGSTVTNRSIFGLETNHAEFDCFALIMACLIAIFAYGVGYSMGSESDRLTQPSTQTTRDEGAVQGRFGRVRFHPAGN